LSVPFSYLHFHYELTFKILVFALVLFGLWGTQAWVKKLQYSTLAQLFAVAAFAINPYLINTIVFRGNIGEIFAVCLFPWLFWCIEKIREEHIPSKKSIIHPIFYGSALWTTIYILIFSLFSLSHNITAIFGIPIVLVYAAIRVGRNVQQWKKLLFILFMSFLATLWFWLPAVLEKSVTIVDDVSVNTQFTDHFPSLNQLLFSPLKFGFSFKGSIDSLSFSLGILQLVCLGITTLYLLKKIIYTKKIQLSVPFFAVIAGWIFFFFQLPSSQIIWNVFSPIAKYIQFPWRLGLFWQVIIIPVTAFIFSELSRVGKMILICLLVWQLIAFSRIFPADYFHRDLRDYDYFSESTSTLNENRVRAFTFQDLKDWQPSPLILHGNGQATVEYWKGSDRQYTVHANSDVLVVEPTMNFLGWQTVVNGKKVSYTDSDEIGGRIAYHLSSGDYQVRTRFTQWTAPRIIGNTASVVVIVFLFAWLGKEQVAKLQKRKAKQQFA
jgi:hypothetical protein